jgi:hypothetical protein
MTRALKVAYKGGPGSGNFGHAGRPGEEGGSAPGDDGVPEGFSKQPPNYVPGRGDTNTWSNDFILFGNPADALNIKEFARDPDREARETQRLALRNDEVRVAMKEHISNRPVGSGVRREIADGLLRGWALSANDSRSGLVMQASAARVYGVTPSLWQQQQMLSWRVTQNGMPTDGELREYLTLSVLNDLAVDPYDKRDSEVADFFAPLYYKILNEQDPDKVVNSGDSAGYALPPFHLWPDAALNAARELIAFNGTSMGGEIPPGHMGVTPVVATNAGANLDAALREIYRNTQTELQLKGLDPDDTLRLYRGVTSEKDLKVGMLVSVVGNVLESWTSDRETAAGFAGRRIDDTSITPHSHSYVLATDVKVRNIVSTCRTGFGSLPEYEYVTTGGIRGTKTLVAESYDLRDLSHGVPYAYYKRTGNVRDKVTDDTTVIEIQDPVNANWIHYVPDVADRDAEITATESIVQKGGPGSGNFGHAGRPGEEGGSAPGGSDTSLERMSPGQRRALFVTGAVGVSLTAAGLAYVLVHEWLGGGDVSLKVAAQNPEASSDVLRKAQEEEQRVFAAGRQRAVDTMNRALNNSGDKVAAFREHVLSGDIEWVVGLDINDNVALCVPGTDDQVHLNEAEWDLLQHSGLVYTVLHNHPIHEITTPDGETHSVGGARLSVQDATQLLNSRATDFYLVARDETMHLTRTPAVEGLPAAALRAHINEQREWLEQLRQAQMYEGAPVAVQVAAFNEITKARDELYTAFLSAGFEGEIIHHKAKESENVRLAPVIEGVPAGLHAELQDMLKLIPAQHLQLVAKISTNPPDHMVVCEDVFLDMLTGERVIGVCQTDADTEGLAASKNARIHIPLSVIQGRLEFTLTHEVGHALLYALSATKNSAFSLQREQTEAFQEQLASVEPLQMVKLYGVRPTAVTRGSLDTLSDAYYVYLHRNDSGACATYWRNLAELYAANGAAKLQSIYDYPPQTQRKHKIITVVKGGPGSGNFGHVGRPGEEGGSAPGDSVSAGSSAPVWKRWGSIAISQKIERYPAGINVCHYDKEHPISVERGYMLPESTPILVNPRRGDVYMPQISPDRKYEFITHGQMQLATGMPLQLFYQYPHVTYKPYSGTMYQSDAIDLLSGDEFQKFNDEAYDQYADLSDWNFKGLLYASQCAKALIDIGLPDSTTWAIVYRSGSLDEYKQTKVERTLKEWADVLREKVHIVVTTRKGVK